MLTKAIQYSYLTTIPLITAYAVGFAIIKYSYGYTIIPEIGGSFHVSFLAPLLIKPSNAHTLSIVESICAKRDIPVISLAVHRLGTRNVGFSFVVLLVG